MNGVLPSLALLAAVGVLVHVIYVDFNTLKVRNRAVLVLLACYAVWAALTGFATLPSDLAVALILFLIALLMWLAGAMGAGDVKLYAALGLLVGIRLLGLYVLLLLLVSVIFVLLLRLSPRMRGQGHLVKRLREFNQTGKAPYAVPMGIAAIPAIVVRSMTFT